METEYGQAYGRLYREHWWWRAREEYLLAQLRQLDLATEPRIFDIGCGNGLFFPRLEELGGVVAGLEADQRLLAADGGYRARIHVGPFDDSFETDCRYDLVTMLDVLEHLPDPRAALRQAAHMLEPGGYLVVTVPAFRGLWTKHDEMNHHYTRYTKRTILPVAQSAGLDILRLQYFFAWLAPLKLMVRAKEFIVRSPPVPPRVPNKIVNGFFLTLSRFEQRLGKRLSPPFGSSLLLIGSRQ